MLYVIDRKKEILKCKGHQINPSEIENVIAEFEGVEQVSVVGIPDDFVNNLMAAAIVKRKGFESLIAQQIVDYVAKRLPDYKQLHGGAYFFNDLPSTLSDKIQKRFVLEEILKLKK
jgi:acyl-coenzyme A synthetase/AMP-(fatty) acid ligase